MEDISNLSGNAVVGPGAVVELTDSPLLLLPALASPLQSSNRKQVYEFMRRDLNNKIKLMSPVHFNLTIATGILNLWVENLIIKLRLPKILPIL